jgi:hypothetical protein
VVFTLGLAPAAAQTASPRGFLTLSAAALGAGPEMTEQLPFQANAETGSLDARYRPRTALLFDAGVGFRFWRRMGMAMALSQASGSHRAEVTARVPHPLYDDRDRLVQGEATGLTRSETAAHLKLFYEIIPAGRWRLRLFGGPSYINVEQALVQDVTVNETYPYDTATFERAVTGRRTGAGLGFNAGADASWMFGRRVGAGLLVRYARARVDLNVPDAGTVSSRGGGMQAGAGIRFLF